MRRSRRSKNGRLRLLRRRRATAWSGRECRRRTRRPWRPCTARLIYFPPRRRRRPRLPRRPRLRRPRAPPSGRLETFPPTTTRASTAAPSPRPARDACRPAWRPLPPPPLAAPPPPVPRSGSPSPLWQPLRRQSRGGRDAASLLCSCSGVSPCSPRGDTPPRRRRRLGEVARQGSLRLPRLIVWSRSRGHGRPPARERPPHVV
mmetsp:Transcript_30576/g.101223  ORF Transcript_30576/g.101223 Transcript_30576/m.101223 type:complete len:203 (-) Transcript_30576:63-671(-)